MANKTPVFPYPTQPQHFNDYGFDPQIDYFQVLEEARRHKRENLRSIDALHFKLQKPISKEDSKKNKSKKKRRWWRNALLFWRWKWIQNVGDDVDDLDDVYIRKNRYGYRAAISGPVYITESKSGSVTPSRCSSRTTSGPLAGTLTPARKEEVDIPYVSLRELNMDYQQQQQMIYQRLPNSPMPIYLVT